MVSELDSMIDSDDDRVHALMVVAAAATSRHPRIHTGRSLSRHGDQDQPEALVLTPLRYTEGDDGTWIITSGDRQRLPRPHSSDSAQGP